MKRAQKRHWCPSRLIIRTTSDHHCYAENTQTPLLHDLHWLLVVARI